MAAVLNIKDSEVHALASEIAITEGTTMVQAVKTALQEKRARMADSRGGLAGRLMAIGAECTKLPVLDSRTPEEIIGYDDLGVPR